MSDSIYKLDNKQHRLGLSMEAIGTLRIIGYCGLAGVLVDIDHIAWAILLYSDPTLPFNGRFLHITIGVATSCAICSISAYIGRLYIKYILEKKRKVCLT